MRRGAAPGLALPPPSPPRLSEGAEGQVRPGRGGGHLVWEGSGGGARWGKGGAGRATPAGGFHGSRVAEISGRTQVDEMKLKTVYGDSKGAGSPKFLEALRYTHFSRRFINK